MVNTNTESESPKISTDKPLPSPEVVTNAGEIKQEGEPTVEMPTKISDEVKLPPAEDVDTSVESVVEVSVEVKEVAVDTDPLSAIEKTSRSVANGKNEGPDGMYQPGSKLEALDMSTNKWYSVKVVEVDWDDREVLIHFEKWSQRFDEWIPMDSSRLRPVGDKLDSQSDKPSGYRVGETVMATWSDCRKYPARVKAILSGDLVEVLFFDGFVKRMKLSKIAKCVGDQGIEPVFDYPILPGLPPGPAALMSKAERRERKRKIPTVMELFQYKKPSKKPKESSSDSPRHAIGSPPSVPPEHSAKDSGSETEKGKAKYADWTTSDNEGEKTYINLDTSFKEEDGTPTEAKKAEQQSGKSKGKAKQADKKGGKVEKRKRSYNKVVLDDSPAGTYRESFPFKGRRTNEALPPNDYDNWEPEGQEAYVVETSDGLRRSIIVADDRLPEGWAKHTIQRRSGNSAGKWDVFLVSPTGRRFRSRKEMVSYFNDSGNDYKPELFDFTLRCNMMRKRDDTVHVKKIDRKHAPKQGPARAKPAAAAAAQGAASEVSAAATEDLDQHRRVKTLLPKAPSQQRGEGLATPPPPPHHPCTIAPPAEASSPLPPLDDGKVYVGTVEVQMQDNALVCPKEGCLKHFRRENLLQMHMKHYHPEYTQFLGSTPNVADLAYARTVGEPIEDIVPPSRTVAVAVNRFEASKKAKQLAAMSPPAVVPESPAEGKKKAVGPKKDATSDVRKSIKTVGVAEPVSPAAAAVDTKELLCGAPVDLEQFIKPMKCAAAAQSTPLRDLLRREPLRGPTAGIKTLLPVARQAASPKDSAAMQKKVLAGDDWVGFPPSPGVAGVASGQGARIRKRRLSDNSSVEQNAAKRKRPAVKVSSLDDSIDSIVAASSASADDLGSSFLTPAASRYHAMKKRTPILAATLAQPLLDALDMSEPMGSPLTPLTPAEQLVEDQLNKIDIINCTCGVMEEDGLMIQCDLCLCWQHGYCNAIERESQVPDKYVCAICLHPARQRDSMRHLHDQAWLKEGKLPSLDPARPQPAAARLAASHDLTATLLEVRDVVHSLRVKCNIANSADHPKLYLWAKPWQKDTFDATEEPPADLEAGLKPELAVAADLQPLNSGGYADVGGDAAAEIPVKAEEVEADRAAKQMADGAAAGEEAGGDLAGSQQNVTGDTALAQAALDNGEKQDSQLDSQLLLQALTSGSTNGSNNELLDDAAARNQLLQFPICQSELMRFAHSMADNLKVTVPEPPPPPPAPAVAPEPEKPIDPVECRLLLLDHIQHHQQQVKDKLQLLEEQIAALEAEDPETLSEETNTFFPQTKQTIKMLLRDLTTVRNIAAIN